MGRSSKEEGQAAGVGSIRVRGDVGMAEVEDDNLGFMGAPEVESNRRRLYIASFGVNKTFLNYYTIQ